MNPGRWFYRHHESEPTTKVGIRHSLAGDLYLTLNINPQDIGSQSASLELFVNPLVDWIWMGFGILAIGTGIALLPEQTFSFVLARLPAEAVTTTVALLVLVFWATPLVAQSMAEPVPADPMPRNALEQQLHADINCTCGGCFGPLKDCPMMYCQSRHEEKIQIQTMVDRGLTHDQILDGFVKEYGGEYVLNAPIDKGFNRLAWLFPYLVGGSGAVLLGFSAVKWSRRPAAPPEAPAEGDPSLDDRLDDELRDLD